MNNNILVPVRAVLSSTATRWQVLAEIIPPELLTRIPAKNEWSAVECLQHMIDTERQAFPVRLQAFLNGQDFPGFNPALKTDRAATKPSPLKMAKEFTDLRRVSLELLERVTPIDLPRKARHAELGQVTLEEMLNEWAGHDLMHLAQAERAIMQYFIPGTGAWRKYFADHDVEIKK
jgi:hypothetical protein